MRAVTVVPGTTGSLRLDDVPEPDARSGSMLVEALAVGICGTDVEIAEGKYGWPPPGRQRLILGHESLGRVVDPGDLTGVGSANAIGHGVGRLATEAVLKNLVVFGSVNANRRHYYRAAKALAAADPGWLSRLVTRRVGLTDMSSALRREPDDIKVLLEFGHAG